LRNNKDQYAGLLGKERISKLRKYSANHHDEFASMTALLKFLIDEFFQKSKGKEEKENDTTVITV